MAEKHETHKHAAKDAPTPGGWQGAFLGIADALDIEANSMPGQADILRTRKLASLFRAAGGQTDATQSRK